jgi:histidinol-phosphate aminotransferase
VASLEDPDQVRRSWLSNRENRDYLYAECKRMGLPYVETQANFVLLDVKQPCKPVYEALMRRGVIVRTLGGLPTHLRVTIGRRSDNERFIRELEAVLSESPAALAGAGKS